MISEQLRRAAYMLDKAREPGVDLGERKRSFEQAMGLARAAYEALVDLEKIMNEVE